MSATAEGGQPPGGLGEALRLTGMPDAAASAVVLRGLRGALDVDGEGLSGVQVAVVDALTARFVGEGMPSLAAVDPIGPTELLEVLDTPDGRGLLAHLCVLLELLDDPVRPEVESHVEAYLGAMHIPVPEVDIARDTAKDHLVRLHADLMRNSWYTEQTLVGAASGKLWEYARSKLAYYGVAGDKTVARRWEGLADCPPGSWGKAVADFYETHSFPFPGEHHGIYEIGALHDWVHVLTDYSTDPEGEIDVFAFISATMTDPRGFVQFIFTLALFQNASVDTVGGLPVKIARGDTLSEPGAPDRLADALWRASRCTADPMGGVDHFALKDEPLEDLRRQWSVPPKSVPSAGAHEVVVPGEGYPSG